MILTKNMNMKIKINYARMVPNNVWQSENKKERTMISLLFLIRLSEVPNILE
jgi:hypothetical protein